MFVFKLKNFFKTKLSYLIPIYRLIRNKLVKEKSRFITTEKIFSDIYNENKWGGKQSRSGPDIMKRTETIRRMLPELLKEYHIHSILDIPCGDFYWMREVNLDSISYVGADIVEKMIQENQNKYSKENRKFIKLDILRDELPKSDLIFCKDLLIHLSNKAIIKAMKNIKKSDSKYLLTTSFMLTTKNQDILTGEWHPINLLIPPFSYKAPLKIVDLKLNIITHLDKHKGKSLLLWKISDL